MASEIGVRIYVILFIVLQSLLQAAFIGDGERSRETAAMAKKVLRQPRCLDGGKERWDDAGLGKVAGRHSGRARFNHPISRRR
ncbi:MAG: hypothetical protein ABI843_08905 [Dokdonella sp.]